MAIGLPVVATPIPSYEPVIKQGVNGFLARSQGDWVRCLSALRDPDARRAIGRNARESALTGYSKELQAQRLIEVLRSVASGGSLSAYGLDGRPT
jgi:glycosyltransferase involved in cell wall biosynthesis